MLSFYFDLWDASVILSTICFSLITGMVVADDCIGTSIIPRYKIIEVEGNSMDYKWETHLFLSNLSGDTTDVYLKLYKQDGSLLTTASAIITSFNADDFCTTNTYCSASFSIAENESVMIQIRPSTDTNIAENLIFGYGKVEWDRASGVSPVSLIGDGYMWFDCDYTNGAKSSFGEHFDLGSKSSVLF